MYKINVYNKIAQVGLDELPSETYEVGSDYDNPDAILCRSQDLHKTPLNEGLIAIARAGAGVNNIPVDEMTKRGVVVFNTPGANANAVKELVISAMLLGSRNIVQGWDFLRQMGETKSGDDKTLHKRVEENKKQFIGFELAGKTLGVIGLGAIGVKVANTAHALGMEVLGYDPMISVQRAWELSAQVIQADNVEEILQHCDIVTIHVPLIDATRGLINASRLKLMRDDAMLINFARAGIVDDAGVKEALDNKKLKSYITDFASEALLGHPNVIALPHLGASTHEAEENCAVMAVRQLRHYLEDGSIENAVNFPTVHMTRGGKNRLIVVNSNVPNIIAQVSGIFGSHNVNIVDLINKSREDIAITIIDVNDPVPDATINDITTIKGVLSARSI